MRTLLNQDQLYDIDPKLRSRRTALKLEAAIGHGSGDFENRTKSLMVPLSVWVLPRACFRSVWTDVTAMIPMRLVLTGFTFAQPFLFTRAIDYLGQQNHDATVNIGYGLIGATFIIYTGIAVSDIVPFPSGFKLNQLADIECTLPATNFSHHDQIERRLDFTDL